MAKVSMKRKDNKGRILKQNEFQKSNGLYEFRYRDKNGELRSEYSWRLTPSDQIVSGKRKNIPLRNIETEIFKSINNNIDTFNAKKTTLNDRFEVYISSKKELKVSTFDNYLYMYNKYVKPYFGKRKIAEIRYSDILSFYKKLIFEKGFKPNSLETINTLLNPVFEHAVKDQLISINPCKGAYSEIKHKVPVNNKIRALTITEQKLFLNFIKNSQVYNHWESIFVFLLGTGLRIGEALGLTWDDIDFEKREISVNHTLLYRVAYQGNAAFMIQKPKTKAGIRIVPMFDEVRRVLLFEKDRQTKVGVKDIEIDGYKNFVFTNRLKKVTTPASINRAIKRIVESYNAEEKRVSKLENREEIMLPNFSAHVLRHTFCTRFCEKESNVKIIQEIMGHSDVSTTLNIYTDITDQMKKESFAKLQGKVFIC